MHKIRTKQHPFKDNFQTQDNRVTKITDGNGQTEPRDHTLVDIEDQQATQRLVEAMKGKLRSLSHISEDCCIYRVPKRLRDINEDAYLPQMVSLGPYHHGNESLKSMEEHKWRCFRSFIEQNSIDLDALVRLMKRHERKSRGFYAESIALSSDQFVQVILVDAIFVINLLLETHISYSAPLVRGIYHKDLFLFEVCRDMLLLENQLPFFILEEVLDLAKSTSVTRITEQCSVPELTHCLFGYFMEKEGVTDINSSEVRHFIDFQRLIYLPESMRQQPRYEGTFKVIKSITGLHEAGVRFKLASTKKLLGVHFKDGVLEIPRIDVMDITETIFRNLLAYDQCHHGSSHMSDYFVLMGMLIDTPDDVQLLVKNDIMKNHMANNLEVSKLFNNLEKEVMIDENMFYYSHLCEELDDYCRIPRHRWMATLKHNYLNTPWAVISAFAASILIVLTLIQTVCSVISL